MRDRETFARKILYKEWSWTHSHRLWCSDGPWEKLTAYKRNTEPCSAAAPGPCRPGDRRARHDGRA
ncbi:hypothetical protein TNCT1_18840 [Streptomyces sp. 1-11]|nr:hypothetical protein TNCT1_18840 [Streptomyces sp. 1-11]